MEEQPASPSPPAAAPVPAPKKRSRLWIVVAVVVVVVILIGAYFAFFAGPSEDRVLKIATILAITGALSPFGPNNQNGTQMAVDEINAAGGVLGQPIQVFHFDSKTDPTTAAAAARTAISTDHVDAIIGATGSGQCAQIVPIAAANHVFEISASCTSPIFSNTTFTGGFWARTAPSDALQGVVAAWYARHNLTMNYTAVIGINTAYGTGLAGVYASSFKKFGGNLTDDPPVIVTEVQAGATDYTTQLTQIMSASPAPQLIYLVAYPQDGVLMVKNWETLLGSHPSWAGVKWMFSEGLYDQKNFLSVLYNPPNSVNVSAFQGTAPSAYGGLTGPNFASWAQKYQTKFGHAPSLFDDNAYDAVYLIALAAQKAGLATGDAIKANIQAVSAGPGTTIYPGQWSQALSALGSGQGVNYEGASGSVNLNAQGDPLSGYIVWGANSTGQATVSQIFPESLVTSLVSQVGSMSVSASSTVPTVAFTPLAVPSRE